MGSSGKARRSFGPRDSLASARTSWSASMSATTRCAKRGGGSQVDDAAAFGRFSAGSAPLAPPRVARAQRRDVYGVGASSRAIRGLLRRRGSTVTFPAIFARRRQFCAAATRLDELADGYRAEVVLATLLRPLREPAWRSAAGPRQRVQRARFTRHSSRACATASPSFSPAGSRSSPALTRACQNSAGLLPVARGPLRARERNTLANSPMASKRERPRA